MLNIEADPHVRFRFHCRWHEGRAHAVEDDDPLQRAMRINPLNGAFLWLANPRRRMLSLAVELRTA